MKENKIAELSMGFSVDIINLVQQLKANHESIISNQIGRSGTSIGANIYEAQYAQDKKDFISKLEIALKEASETGYWLELLHRTKHIDAMTYKALSAKCTSLRVILIALCRTAKENETKNEMQTPYRGVSSCTFPLANFLKALALAGAFLLCALVSMRVFLSTLRTWNMYNTGTTGVRLP